MDYLKWTVVILFLVVALMLALEGDYVMAALVVLGAGAASTIDDDEAP